MQDTSPRHYAGFWIRLWADIADGTLLTVVSWLLELALLGAVYGVRSALEGSQDSFWDAFNPMLVQVINLVLYAAIAFPYYVIGHFKYGTTLGKRPFRIRVVDARTYESVTFRQSVVRCLSYFLSYLPFSTGFMMAAFQPEKRALHDLIAGTVSIVEARPSKALNVPLVTALLAVFFAPFSQAAEREASPVRGEGHTWQVMSSIASVGPSSYGLDLGGAILLAPVETLPLWLGPRVVGMIAYGSTLSRAEVGLGGEGTFWLANAIGPGFAVDWIAPSWVLSGAERANVSAAHFRLEGMTSIRLKRAGEGGAWGARIGIHYDTRYQWGARIGMAIQLGGVPNIGDLSGS